MIWYENKTGDITGRMYEAGANWGAEVGRQGKFGFVAVRSKRCRTSREAEHFLLENGCTCSVVA